MKIDEVYQKWKENKKKQVKLSTICAYSLIFTNHILPKFANVEVEHINKRLVQDFVDNKLSDGLSVKSVKDIIIVLKMIVNYAGDELELNVNTTWRLYWPTKNMTSKSQIPVYTKNEFRKIVDACKEHPSPVSLGILLTICSGMRIGEVCALRFSDIDIEKKLIYINRTIERVYILENGVRKTELIISSPKTASSRRQIPLIGDALILAKKFHAIANPDYYICSFLERPIEPRTFRSKYVEFMKDRCGIEHVIKFHGLRHTFASLLIEDKVDVKTVADILGHSDVSTTLNTYVHPSEAAKREVMNKSIRKILR